MSLEGGGGQIKGPFKSLGHYGTTYIYIYIYSIERFKGDPIFQAENCTAVREAGASRKSRMGGGQIKGPFKFLVYHSTIYGIERFEGDPPIMPRGVNFSDDRLRKFQFGYAMEALLCPLYVTSPPNSNTGGSRLIFSVSFSYFLYIFYLPRCTLSHFPSASSLASLPFLPC